GKKQNKLRITVVLATNVDGSYKVPLLFVGVSKKPRCFIKTSTADLGVEYASTKKGWMTSEYVLLILDNASSHAVINNLTNVSIKFLPPNTNAILQPIDSGIIRSFKAQLKNLKDAAIVDRLMIYGTSQNWKSEKLMKTNRRILSKQRSRRVMLGTTLP
ncbi:Major centromere autoantigen B, partial [Thraustotheca clavata]